MKLVISVVAALVLVGLIVTLAVGGGMGAEPDGEAAVSRTQGAVSASPADAAEARKVLTAVARSYEAVGELTERMDIVYVTPAGEQEVTYEVAFDDDGRIAQQIPGYRMIADDGSLIVLRDGIEHKYLEVPLGNDPSGSFRRVLGGRPAPVHFAMRWSDDPSTYLPSLTMGMLQNPRVAGVTGDAPHPYLGETTAVRVDLAADNGTGRVFIDKETNLLAAAEMEFVKEDARDYSLQIRFTPEIPEQTPELVVFSPGERMKVTNLAALDVISVGEPMPDFALLTSDGKVMRKRHLAGSVTVMDFWATWCGPCKMALPHLEEFHVWAQESGQPVKVFAVDVWEKFPSRTQKLSAANNYWKSKEFTMPLLFDLDDELVAKLGIKSIPTTVVVDAEGKIAKIHRGYDPRMKQTLQNDVQAILAGGG